jgi:hypothetical protein
MPCATKQPRRPGPPDLEDAINPHSNRSLEGGLPFSGCELLLRDSYHPPRAATPYTWGFRIYRTTYGSPNASNDADFARAMDILHGYMRYELFRYNYDPGSTLDGAANDAKRDNAKNVLWRRLRNEIVQDRELLEGASPEKITGLAREWFKTLQYDGIRVCHSSQFRYPLVVDEEVVRNLLQLPMPAEYEDGEAATYTIKVCDLHVDEEEEEEEEDPEEDMPSDDDEMWSEPEDDGYRSWFWISADYLAWLWFEEGNAATEEVYTWVNCPAREERRFLFWRTGLGLGCMHSEAEHRAMYPSLFRDENGDGLEDVGRPCTATANLT